MATTMQTRALDAWQRGVPAGDIAKQFGTTAAAIRKRLERAGVPLKELKSRRGPASVKATARRYARAAGKRIKVVPFSLDLNGQ